MGLLSVELVTKRLQSANGTQDGIESISTWILHHSDSVRMVSDCWLNLFRTESEERRVVLFYIMNDVVQRAKKKHVDVVCSTFEQPVISAVSLARFSEKLRSVMSRCLKLIAECKAFSATGIDKMNRIIADPNGDTDDGNYEIDVVDLAKKIEAFMKSVVSINKGYEIIKRAPQDYDEQIQTRMKDRKEGANLLKETRSTITRLERFAEAVANNNKRLYEFVDAIETAKRLFNMQLRDVAVVEDAYVKFGQGVREVQEEVEEMLRTGVYPAGSPPRDAPSPSADDDVFAGGVEQVLNKMRPHDVTDEADMEVDDDEPPPQHFVRKPPPSAAPVSSSRPSLVDRVHALAATMPSLASHMGIDPRARASTAASSSSTPSDASSAPPPVKKPSIDSAALHEAFVRAAATIPAVQQAKSATAYPGAALPSAAPPSAPPSSFSIPPPHFTPNMPPPTPAAVAQYMVMQQQQQQQQQHHPQQQQQQQNRHQQQAAAASNVSAPLAVHTMPPSVPSVPPPISPYSAPPPGYPPVAAAHPPQQFHSMQQPPPTHQQQQNRSHFSPPTASGYSMGYGGGAAAGGYQQPPAAPTQPQFGGTQQGQKKYSTMPEYGRSNSNPSGGASGYGYPLHNTPTTPGSSSSAAAAAGTPYTPTAPGLMGRRGSEGTGVGYGRGGGQYGGYGNRQEEHAPDAYQPQHRQDGHHDSDYRQKQQYTPRGGGGGGRGYNRGNQGGGYGRFQRGGPRGRGGFGGQQNYGGGGGGGGYNNQGY